MEKREKFKENLIIRGILITIILLFILPEIANYKCKKLYEIYTLRCWEIAVKKYKSKKTMTKIYSIEYFKLVTVLEKCKKCQSKYYVEGGELIK